MTPFPNDDVSKSGWEPVDQHKRNTGNHREPLWEPLSEGIGLERESDPKNLLTSGNADREPPGTSSGTSLGVGGEPSGTNEPDPPTPGNGFGFEVQELRAKSKSSNSRTREGSAGDGGESRDLESEGIVVPSVLRFEDPDLARAMRDAPGTGSCPCSYDGVEPHGWDEDGTGLRARYYCPGCGRVWTCWWRRESLGVE